MCHIKIDDPVSLVLLYLFIYDTTYSIVSLQLFSYKYYYALILKLGGRANQLYMENFVCPFYYKT